MLMFLTILLLSLPVLVIACLIVAGAAPRREAAVTPEPEKKAILPPSRFFEIETGGSRPPSRLPADMLLRQLERHVRLERAAAETFLELPSAESLHAQAAASSMN